MDFDQSVLGLVGDDLSPGAVDEDGRWNGGRPSAAVSVSGNTGAKVAVKIRVARGPSTSEESRRGSMTLTSSSLSMDTKFDDLRGRKV